ncbi:hypothetical protein COY25_00400 [Candidatus Uhrbacteria bacterium CG_4_10_14_0_2_um_filter_41_7]|uniref:Rod shape-determining protein RodA n=1 Tax=Candidatus Uhrbacteria bacterium CG_4_9_14_3_um_filter_41_35 TaxID=1975034 RepID=A0A2M7XFV9_9BACT|nr:MAG: hypothetical protein COV92_00050 [Candidatus Uhrbacteria bacterium CG11_big_fil_rev_8_21_14_0_20_41_9]PIZ55690.1 MAG: hypothetical protein COY25_00400 [Candidatus Uhrbacteria bacterium CG_4_10_14_0_2_um_filter_41_7]PJA46763.1 MAG: hypothetical protein CO173_01575 [Candidatus Uhrbacteria bacterium CG_4_9_14_3_um_filter_41_35]
MIIRRIFERLQKLDWFLLLATLVLVAFGVAAIYSVELSHDGSDFYFLKKHLMIFGFSLLAFFIFASTNYLQLRNYARILYIIGVILLVAVLFFGLTIRGTTGWFVIFGFSFQPVEFMKLALAVELSSYFGEHARRKFGWREIFSSGFLAGVPIILTMLQPDLGSASLLIGMWLMLIFFAGIKWHQAAILGGSAILVIIFAWFFLLAGYQRDRVQVFLNPDLDPLEKGYNIAQAKIAIGSGQLFGRGLGFGSQSQLKFLPESHTDFVFSVIAEELGFFGVTILYLSFLIIFYRILLHSYGARDNFSSFLAIAIFGIIFTQAFINICVNLAILPATGVALPFVSYGGTSLLFSFIMLGIVESMALQSRPGDIVLSRWYN